MSLDSIVKSKGAHFQKLLDGFSSEFDGFTVSTQKELLRLFRRGSVTPEAIKQLFKGDEYQLIVQKWATNYKDVIGYTSQVAKEIGHDFILTKQGIKSFDMIQQLNIDKMTKWGDLYVNEIQSFGVQSALEGRSLAQMTEGLAGIFGTMGRRLNTEAITGIMMADRTIKQDFYDKAGITLYVYSGPYDDKTRDVCRSTLDDPRQGTGWTIEEINSSETPFITCGDWNCRHEWIAYIGESK